MIAAARIGLRYFMLHSLQRWLLPLGALCCSVGLLMYVTDTPGRPMFSMGLVVVHVPAALVAGVAFRHLSACRAHSLTPHFRVTMLVSLLFAVTAIALTWHFSAPLWLHPAALAAAPRGATLLLPFWAATLFVLAGVIAPSSPAAFLGVFTTGSALVAWLTAGGVTQIRSAGIDPLLLAAVTSLTGWGWLGIWYLSTRRGRSTWREMASRAGFAAQAEGAPVTVSSAEASYLTGLPAANATSWYQDARSSVIYAPLALVAGWLLPQLLPDRFSDKLPFLIAITGGNLVLQMGMQAAHETRRARLLWLTHASREEIFHICEGRALRAGALMSAACLALLGPWILQVFGWAAVAWTAVLLPTAALAGGYMGLMAVRGWTLLDVALGCTLVISAYGFIPFVIGVLQRAPYAPPPVLAVLLALAFTYRTVARRRWRRIDWLGLRPLRWFGGYASAGSDR